MARDLHSLSTNITLELKFVQTSNYVPKGSLKIALYDYHYKPQAQNR